MWNEQLQLNFNWRWGGKQILRFERIIHYSRKLMLCVLKLKMYDILSSLVLFVRPMIADNGWSHSFLSCGLWWKSELESNLNKVVDNKSRMLWQDEDLNNRHSHEVRYTDTGTKMVVALLAIGTRGMVGRWYVVGGVVVGRFSWLHLAQSKVFSQLERKEDVLHHET